MDPEIDDMSEPVIDESTTVENEADASDSPCFPLPGEMQGKYKLGDDFSGNIEGKVVDRDGTLSVEITSVEGNQVSARYTGTDEEDGELNGAEALDKYMAGNKKTQ